MDQDIQGCFGLEDSHVIQNRQSDWRIGPLVYHVFVDRFAPSLRLEEKKGLYSAPRRLMQWSEQPQRGSFLESDSVWSHELEFWGGDLESLCEKTDYLQKLGMDCVYLNPIHESTTNHKYGARDYRKISPEYGDRDTLRQLLQRIHDGNMKLMLDGVFNHMGIQSPLFQTALKDPASSVRDWFKFGESYRDGHAGWYDVANLPELNLENPEVQNEIWNGPSSIIVEYLRDGIDGWRLDVAFDIGPEFLSKLTASAHATNELSCIVGEVWTDPFGWSQTMDGVMNFNFRQMVLEMLYGSLSGSQCGRILGSQIDRAGDEAFLKSWLMLDNHDTPRLKTVIQDETKRDFAQTLQFCFPGAPCIYYGVEVGMEGGDDPEMRGPMRWDLVSDENREMTRIKNLIRIRKEHAALRIGSTRVVGTEHLLAFVRYTDRTDDDVLVVANPGNVERTEVVWMGNPWNLNHTVFRDLLSEYKAQNLSGLVSVAVPPGSIRILIPEIDRSTEYCSYKRIR